jgi:hypothetical protein
MLGSAGSSTRPAMPGSRRRLGHAAGRRGGHVHAMPIRVARRYVSCPSVRVCVARHGGRRACRARMLGEAARSARARQGTLWEAPLAVCYGERRLEVTAGGGGASSMTRQTREGVASTSWRRSTSGRRRRRMAATSRSTREAMPEMPSTGAAREGARCVPSEAGAS